jgi:hypothetical protein
MRFGDAMSGVKKPNNFIRVTLAMNKDIQVWLKFLKDLMAIVSLVKTSEFQMRKFLFLLIVLETEIWGLV